MKGSTRFIVIGFIALLFGLIPAPAQITAIKAGKLIDPETGAVSTHQVILIEGSKIKAVGADLSIPAGATVINLSNASVLPGLFDVHTHLCNPPTPLRGLGFDDLRESFFHAITMNSTGYRAIQGVVNARQMLEAGFTTVRDLGHAGNYADTDVRRAIEEGLVPGPAIINAGRKITPYGGQFQVHPERRDLLNPDYLYADTKDELKKAIRENIYYGAKVIKVVVDGQPHIYSADDLRFIVEEAAKAGLKVAAHCDTNQGARNAVEARLASIEHGFGMTDETLALAKKNNVALGVTIPPESLWRQAGIPIETRKPLIQFLTRAYKAGVTMTFGTDIILPVNGQTRGALSLSFAEGFIEAGLPPKAVLQAMTANAARLLGVEKERGAIKPGLAADIIATSESPLDNIWTLKQVTFVMKDGKPVKHPK